MDNNFLYSKLDIRDINKNNESVLKKISKLYSDNYGFWNYGDEDKVTLSFNKFLELHRGETIHYAKNKSGSILGFCSIRSRKNIAIITSECVRKDYRDKGIFKSLISSILNDRCYVDYKLGVISPNPVVLWAMETYEDLKYVNLEEAVSLDPSFGINLSILIDEIRRKFYSALHLTYRRADNIDYKKIKTEFTIKISESELKPGCKDLIEFYNNLMGTLSEGEEWLLFMKYEPRLNNTI